MKKQLVEAVEEIPTSVYRIKSRAINIVKQAAHDNEMSEAAFVTHVLENYAQQAATALGMMREVETRPDLWPKIKEMLDGSKRSK